MKNEDYRIGTSLLTVQGIARSNNVRGYVNFEAITNQDSAFSIGMRIKGLIKKMNNKRERI